MAGLCMTKVRWYGTLGRPVVMFLLPGVTCDVVRFDGVCTQLSL